MRMKITTKNQSNAFDSICLLRLTRCRICLKDSPAVVRFLVAIAPLILLTAGHIEILLLKLTYSILCVKIKLEKHKHC